MWIILQFIVTLPTLYFITLFLNRKKSKEYNRKSAPPSILYLANKYKVDIARVDYAKLTKLTYFIDSFIVALLFSVTYVIDNVYIRLLTVFILLFPLIGFSYHFIGLYYKKKEDD